MSANYAWIARQHRRLNPSISARKPSLLVPYLYLIYFPVLTHGFYQKHTREISGLTVLSADAINDTSQRVPVLLVLKGWKRLDFSHRGEGNTKAKEKRFSSSQRVRRLWHSPHNRGEVRSEGRAMFNLGKAKSLVGLDIGSSSVKAVELK